MIAEMFRKTLKYKSRVELEKKRKKMFLIWISPNLTVTFLKSEIFPEEK